MLTLAVIALTCWFYALFAIPRRPFPDDEGQELAYSRLVGRQRRLAVYAVLATAVAVLALLRSMA